MIYRSKRKVQGLTEEELEEELDELLLEELLELELELLYNGEIEKE